MRRRRPGAATEDHAAAQSAAARIVVVEDAADQFARRVQPRNRAIAAVEDARGGVDAHAAEGEGDPAGDGEGQNGRSAGRSVRAINQAGE